jgi:N-acetylglucosaminyl-diphospho-decaprenol L-rhamnosyltransferase
MVAVSVCIVNYNCRDILRGCLDSLYGQDQGTSFETVVVDNASSDGAPEMVEAEYPDVLLLRNASNEGFSRGNNQAADVARGRYLFFLNNDTIVPAGTLGQLQRCAESHREAGMIGPRLRGTDGKVQRSYRPRPTLASLLHRTYLFRVTGFFRSNYHYYRRDEFDPHHRRYVETLMGAALFLRREVFDECGPWDVDFLLGGEDLHFSDQVARRYFLLFVPEIEIIHHGGVGTKARSDHGFGPRLVGLTQYLRKSGYSRAALWGYKLALTCDLPVQLLLRAVEYAARRLTGRADKAAASLRAVRGVTHFLLQGLPALWKV